MKACIKESSQKVSKEFQQEFLEEASDEHQNKKVIVVSANKVLNNEYDFGEFFYASLITYRLYKGLYMGVSMDTFLRESIEESLKTNPLNKWANKLKGECFERSLGRN